MYDYWFDYLAPQPDLLPYVREQNLAMKRFAESGTITMPRILKNRFILLAWLSPIARNSWRSSPSPFPWTLPPSVEIGRLIGPIMTNLPIEKVC